MFGFCSVDEKTILNMFERAFVAGALKCVLRRMKSARWVGWTKKNFEIQRDLAENGIYRGRLGGWTGKIEICASPSTSETPPIWIL